MQERLKARIHPPNRSLRAKVATGVGLTVFLFLFLAAAVHYGWDRAALQRQAELLSLQIGELMAGSLRHAMLTSDSEMIHQIMADISQMADVEQVQIVGYNHQILGPTGPAAVVAADSLGQEDIACQVCHKSLTTAEPRMVRILNERNRLRLVASIANGVECHDCHPPELEILGVMRLDTSLASIEQYALREFGRNLLVSLFLIAAVVVVIYQLFDRLLLRRIDTFRQPLTSFAMGDFSARIPLAESPSDELQQLALSFNQMMDQYEAHLRQEDRLSELRQAAIVEERERIAAELHDGLAQVLTYISTKTTAARLMIGRQKEQAAVDCLRQLEEAAQDLFLEVRESILGLKLASQVGQGFEELLGYFAEQYSYLSNIPVEVVNNTDTSQHDWGAETELQLLRIVQEALANTRKHALAEKAWIHMEINQPYLHMVVGDNGMGFDMKRQQATSGLQFGLGMMRERAASIGADFQIDSKPGQGTRVHVQIPLTEERK